MNTFNARDWHRKSGVVLITAMTALLTSCETTKSSHMATSQSKDRVSPPLVKFAQTPELNIALHNSVAPCSGPVSRNVLLQPQEISPNADDVLQTQLVVREIERCVPIWSSDDKRWEWQVKSLRTYGFPKDHARPINPADPYDPNIAWSAPGPTFILNTGTAPDRADGSRFKMTLYNYLTASNDYGECEPLANDADNPHYKAPNCFHGNNVTNFHFHGFHISPQPHQDYVLLSLEPFGSSRSTYSAHPHGDTVVGHYKYDVPPLRGNQAPGTHWYHAHKHGATAMQVLNGLVGTFEVHGEFDRQLDAIYARQGQKLEDRLMVVQQLDDQLPGLGGTQARYPLVNGQASPIVKMHPGEIQRWRFVGATMQVAAQLDIGFEEQANGDKPDPVVRQIAMDGVQFAPENYLCQTVINGPDCRADDDPTPGDFTLNPGNRIDLLVQAPLEKGTYLMTHRLMTALGDEATKRVDARTRAIVGLQQQTGDQSRNPALLILVVEGDAKKMDFPTRDEFPKLPAYLADLPAPPKPNNVITYQMSGQTKASEVFFTINDKPYDATCIDESFTLEEVNQIQLENNSQVKHPFHIHTNPFQLISTKSYDGDAVVETTYRPPYVWMDTLALPLAKTDSIAPKAPPPEPPATEFGQAIIRYQALNFTGEFVDHCHILGHEDRGMMQNVIATCPNGNWGVPTSDGGSECVSATIQPPPMCP
ncbi:MAG: multicopper oxidase domain-containing protein [Gammaproteobacteria bacterium]